MDDPFPLPALRRSGLSYEQIAVETGLPVEYVRSFFRRTGIPGPVPSHARALLRQGLDTVEIARRCGCFEPQAWNALAVADNERAAA